jgi:NifU-like protein involved in Fe-S cluster formation
LRWAAGSPPPADAVAGYSALVIDHFDRPRNAGRLESGADVIEGSAGRRVDGGEFIFTARVAGDTLAEVRVQTFGCPHSIAAASWLSERLVGMTQAELSHWDWREAATALEVPTQKRGRMLVLEDAVRALARNWSDRGHP